MGAHLLHPASGEPVTKLKPTRKGAGYHAGCTCGQRNGMGRDLDGAACPADIEELGKKRSKVVHAVLLVRGEEQRRWL